MRRSFLALAFGSLALVPPGRPAPRLRGAAPRAAAADSAILVRFLGRTIDIAPEVRGDPYGQWTVAFGSDVVTYTDRTTAGIAMLGQPASRVWAHALINPALGTPIDAVNRARRHFGVPIRDTATGRWLAVGDEANDEHLNVYDWRPSTSAPMALTHELRVDGIALNAGALAFAARLPGPEPHRYCIRLLALSTGSTRTIACDDSSATVRMNLGWVRFAPDGKHLYAGTQAGSEGEVNIAELDAASGGVSRPALLPHDSARSWANIVGWTDSDHAIIASDDGGPNELYELSLTSGLRRKLTDDPAGVGAEMPGAFKLDGRWFILIDHNVPQHTVYGLLDIASGREIGREDLAGTASLSGWNPAGAWLAWHTSASTPGEADVLRVSVQRDSAAFTLTPKVRQTASAGRAVDACRVEKVVYPTFDTDPASGRPRLIHALLRMPRHPPSDPRLRLASVLAFYGGDDDYDPREAMLCAAGVATLSPAVRGSSGYGRDFEAETNGDRGGDEIVDVIYGARFLQKRLGLQPRQIGVHGMSRGGYNVMRTLTFQPETNGRNAAFDFGFGIAESGYSSMLTILQHTNTSSPEIIATGDPSTEAGRRILRERSPLDQVARLSAPLLLIHGTHDERVDIAESRQMYAAARARGKDVTLVELEGEGHGPSAEANIVKSYRSQLAFLERVARRNAAH